MSAKSFLSKTEGFERRLGVSVCHHDWEAEGPGCNQEGRKACLQRKRAERERVRILAVGGPTLLPVCF